MNDCGLKRLWSQTIVVSNECGLKQMWSQTNVVSNECGLKWVWSQVNVVSTLKWMWSQTKKSHVNVVLNEQKYVDLSWGGYNSPTRISNTAKTSQIHLFLYLTFSMQL